MNWYQKANLRFAQFLESKNNSKVLAHIAGPSGSGKTTILNDLSKKYPSVDFKDLDDFDDKAVEILGWKNVPKKQFTDKMIKSLAAKRQELMNAYIAGSGKQIVFGGHHTEGDTVLEIPTNNKWMLDVDARTSALRAYQRSQNEDQKFRRLKSELPSDTQEAQEIIDFLKTNGYKPMSAIAIDAWMAKNIK